MLHTTTPAFIRSLEHSEKSSSTADKPGSSFRFVSALERFWYFSHTLLEREARPEVQDNGKGPGTSQDLECLYHPVRGGNAFIVVVDEGNFGLVLPEFRHVLVRQRDTNRIHNTEEQWKLSTACADSKNDRRDHGGDCLVVESIHGMQK